MDQIDGLQSGWNGIVVWQPEWSCGRCWKLCGDNGGLKMSCKISSFFPSGVEQILRPGVQA